MSAFHPWTKPHFKEKTVGPKLRRGFRMAKVTRAEQLAKTSVRQRDRYCRMPLCGCFRFKLGLHVSHSEHKGAGGNPKGERSHPDKLLYMCAARHRENRVSIDNGTLRWCAIGRDAKGHVLVAWEVDLRALKHGLATIGSHRPEWFEVARETGLHIFEPFTPAQRAILDQLAEMKI